MSHRKPRRARFSYPPTQWRARGFENITGRCWVLTCGSDLRYRSSYATKIDEKIWDDADADEDAPLFYVRERRTNAKFWVDARRCFDNRQDSEIEAINLNLHKEYRESMGKQWPHEDVSEAGALLPEAILTVKIVEGEESETKNGKYQILFKGRVVEPKKCRNMPYRIAFVIGTDDDLEADEAETWTSSFAASRYKSFLKATDTPETGDVEEEVEAVVGNSVVIDNGHSSDGKYNEARAFYRVGERESDEPDSGRKSSKKTAKPHDDEDDESKSHKKPAKKAKRPEPEEEDDESGGEDDEDWE